MRLNRMNDYIEPDQPEEDMRRDEEEADEIFEDLPHNVSDPIPNVRAIYHNQQPNLNITH